MLFGSAVCLIYAGHFSEAIKVLQQAIGVAKTAGVRNAYTTASVTWLATALRDMAQHYSGLVSTNRNAILKQADVAARRAIRASRICRNDLPRALRERALIGAMRGTRKTKIRKLLDRSLEVAEQLGEKYEYARSMLVRGQIGLEMGWPDAAKQVEQGQLLMARFTPDDHASPELNGPIQEFSTLSLADRFDTVLDSGRKIASSLSSLSVYQGVHAAAWRLLRGERCLVLEVGKESEPPIFTPVAGDVGEGFDRELVEKAIAAGCAVTQGQESVEVEMASRSEDSVQLVFSVQDTGIGIPADKQQSVFEAFRQSDSSTTREYGGTGLGLAITARLTKLMEGLSVRPRWF